MTVNIINIFKRITITFKLKRAWYVLTPLFEIKVVEKVRELGMFIWSLFKIYHIALIL